MKYLAVWILMLATHGLAAEDAPIGWAAHGTGTRGGASGETIEVRNAESLIRAAKGEKPRIVKIIGKLELKEDVRVGSNITLLGADERAALSGGGLNIRNVSNVIVRNLSISQAGDAVNIEGSQHVWIDHCDLSKCRDGLLDIKRGSDFVTVSWNHFHDHHKTCLLGHSDQPDIRAIDQGHLRVTYHHNFFDGTNSRHPRVRFAEGVHVFNNYYRKNDYGVAAPMNSAVLVEGNVFEDVKQPTLIRYGDSPDPGRLKEHGNLFIRSGEPISGGEFEERKLIPYEYKLDPVEKLTDLISREAGPRKGSSSQ